MKIAKIVSVAGLIAMSAVLLYAFTQGDIRATGTAMLRDPWGIVSLVDLYTGFILFSGWIVFREPNTWRAVPWVAGMLVLGFFTGSLYTLYAAATSRGDWKRFWMGDRAHG